ncbi:MAG TPA: 2OG-Fe(II) oxygenase [Gammaproteobacteria bacterium]|nr:2OG-Fe(II) oxygenase [Gammaproteobacteria bacterium]
MKNNNIIVAEQLEQSHLDKLIANDITAVMIKQFYFQDNAVKIADKIIASSTVEQYTHELKIDDELHQEYLGVDREGMPFNLLYDTSNQNLINKYYVSARENIARIRSYAAPAMTPIDKLRLELDENYTYGAMIAAFQQRKMLAGIGRLSHAEMSHMSENPPHFDALPVKFAALSQQFAANIYLKVPEEGGELELWDTAPMTPLSIVPDDWRSHLPPSMLLKPEVGDLIIFNCRKPHAIRSFTGEPRVTMQVFIGYQEEKPLQLWN